MFLLPIFLPICILLFSPYPTTVDGNAEFVDAVVNALTAASTGSADVLMALSLLGPQAALLMKVVIPVGSFVVQTANPKPQSEEYKALMDLANRTEEIWKDIQRRIEITTRGVDAKIMVGEYLMKVELPIAIMKELTDEYIIPIYTKSDKFFSDYRQACTFGNNAPLSILDYLHMRLVTKCDKAVSQAEAEALAEHRAYFMRILLRLQVDNEPMPDPGLYLLEFLAIYELLDNDILNEDLDVFNRYFSTYRKAVHALFEELQDRASIERVEKDDDGCLLRALIIKTNFNYPAIEAFVSELKNQLIDVTFFGGICANVSHETPAAMYRYTKQIVDRVTLISSFTSTWLNDSLTSAWPSAHNQILKEQIEKIVSKTGHVDNETLNTVAKYTHPLLLNTGMPKHVYELVVVRSVEEEYEFYFEGLSHYCSLNKGASGFDTVICRIPLDSSNQMERDNVEQKIYRLSNYAYDLNITIQYEMFELYAASNLSMIANSLKKKIGKEFITQQDFHGWAIAREWSSVPWNKCPTIDYFSSSYNFVYLGSITTLSYMNKGGTFEDCEVYRFFLFG